MVEPGELALGPGENGASYRVEVGSQTRENTVTGNDEYKSECPGSTGRKGRGRNEGRKLMNPLHGICKGDQTRSY